MTQGTATFFSTAWGLQLITQQRGVVGVTLQRAAPDELLVTPLKSGLYFGRPRL